MAKDPAVLFYTSDFLTGVRRMTYEQVGKYITLLCMQHQYGSLTEKDMMHICGTYDEDIWLKFEKTDAGFINKRMHEEAEKRKRYSESRRNNKLNSIKKQDMINISSSYDKHMENENENEIEVVNRNKIQKKEKAEMVFISPDWEDVWKGWMEYKKVEHGNKFKSAKTEQTAINNLVELSGGDLETAKKVINQSISNNYKGLFKLKEIKNGTSTKSNFDIYNEKRNELHDYFSEIDRQRSVGLGTL